MSHLKVSAKTVIYKLTLAPRAERAIRTALCTERQGSNQSSATYTPILITGRKNEGMGVVFPAAAGDFDPPAGAFAATDGGP
jgi:hypothetical protein